MRTTLGSLIGAAALAAVGLAAPAQAQGPLGTNPGGYDPTWDNSRYSYYGGSGRVYYGNPYYDVPSGYAYDGRPYGRSYGYHRPSHGYLRSHPSRTGDGVSSRDLGYGYFRYR